MTLLQVHGTDAKGWDTGADQQTGRNASPKSSAPSSQPGDKSSVAVLVRLTQEDIDNTVNSLLPTGRLDMRFIDDPSEWDWALSGVETAARELLDSTHQSQQHRRPQCYCYFKVAEFPDQLRALGVIHN